MPSRTRRPVTKGTPVTALVSRRTLRTRPVPEAVEKPVEVSFRVQDAVNIDLEEVDEVFRSVMQRAPRVADKHRDGDYLHVSDLLGKCLRKPAIANKLGLPVPDKELPDGVALTFRLGDAVHAFVKERVALSKADSLYGDWECRCGRHVVRNMLYSAASREQCGTCGGAATKYREVEIRNDELMVVGSPDMLFFIRKYAALLPVEIKSMNPDEWKELVRPKPDHLLQVLFYWELLRRAGRKMLPAVALDYVTKGYTYGSPHKFFVLDAPSIVSRLDPYIADALEAKRAVDEGRIPQRLCCSSMDSSNAKKCHVAVPCFRME